MMRRNLYWFYGEITGIYFLLYIYKVRMFDCDKHSVKGILTCKSGECCTPQLTNVIKADVTRDNYLCGLGSLYDIQDKLPGQKCVAVSGPCHVELSYCYTDDKVSTRETRPTLPPKVATDNYGTKMLGNKIESSPRDERDFIDTITYSTRNTLNREVTARRKTQTRLTDGVTIGVPIVAVSLIVIFVFMFLYIRHRRKRRNESTYDTLMKLSTAEYAQIEASGNIGDHNEQGGSTNPALFAISDDSTCVYINQKNTPLEKGGINISVTTEISDYVNVQSACQMEDGNHDRRHRADNA